MKTKEQILARLNSIRVELGDALPEYREHLIEEYGYLVGYKAAMKDMEVLVTS